MTPREIFRDSLVEYLEQEMVGPEKPGERDVLEESPVQRYSAGILFPCKQMNAELEIARVDEESDGTDEEAEVLFDIDSQSKEQSEKKSGKGGFPENENDDSVRLANMFFPSAIGLSFLARISAKGLVVHCNATTYVTRESPDPDKARREWVSVTPDLAPVVMRPKHGRKRQVVKAVVAPNLEARGVFRLREDGSYLVTVTLVNARVCGGEGPPSGKECFFRVSFTVEDGTGESVFREYPQVARDTTDPEEESLRLLYRNVRVFAVGHGCAPDWGDEIDGCTNQVSTRSVPSFKVAPIEPNEDGGRALEMLFLSGDYGRIEEKEILEELEVFSEQYRSWIVARRADLKTLSASLVSVAERHLAECLQCHERIAGGIEVLRKEPMAMRAFKLANLAILMQQYHNRERPRRTLGQDWIPLPTEYREAGKEEGRWRCFQLAFLLMNLGSFCPADGKPASNGTRDIVDLIWFPTGGGKTEAYLGLTAFVIFMRRMISSKNAGCAVLMRYTLRLLTAQQFQRASALICACETIRKEQGDLGDERISIGLWAGGSLTPNERTEARASLNELARDDGGWRKGRKKGTGHHEPGNGENRFQILTCPWCGTAMDDPENLGYVMGGNPKTVLMVCPERTRCPFGSMKSPLPILVIDEDIYDRPPSLIIGTVDKFAMLAWREKAGGLFGLSDESPATPPELIIQDELHLISGPLGSMVGLYEGAIDMLCSWKGQRPKIVASTATIRRAKEQCRSLYDRETFQFPPPGLDVSDSFFARINPDSPGRMYLGIFASGASSFVTAQVKVLGAVLQGCKHLPLPEGADEDTRDPYWTLLEYFNSLRELGHAVTLVQADIPEYMWAIASRSKIPREKVRTIREPVELTSRRTAHEIPRVLQGLSATYPPATDKSVRPIDALLATNMISVGVDVPRLGLMAVIGQPKTTSEYIQASSRVGRSARVPGLVLALYNPGKPRDRSHFEHFRAYHSSFYRYVEPTSVTPYSIPVLDRALHAILVIIERHLDRLAVPSEIDPRGKWLGKCTAFFEARAKSIDIDPDHHEYLMQRIKEHLDRWKTLKPGEWGRFGRPPEGRPLMHPAGTDPRPEWQELSWPTPSSMRNVDTECAAEVIAQYPEMEDQHGSE